MLRHIVVVCFVLLSGKIQAQFSTSPAPVNQYIEGARVMIDIIQLLKKSKGERLPPTQQHSSSICNFCIINSDSLQRIKVTLICKNSNLPDTLQLVIRPKDRECSLQIKCGVYNCKIEGVNDTIISWGDIFINEKDIEATR